MFVGDNVLKIVFYQWNSAGTKKWLALPSSNSIKIFSLFRSHKYKRNATERKTICVSALQFGRWRSTQVQLHKLPTKHLSKKQNDGGKNERSMSQNQWKHDIVNTYSIYAVIHCIMKILQIISCDWIHVFLVVVLLWENNNIHRGDIFHSFGTKNRFPSGMGHQPFMYFTNSHDIDLIASNRTAKIVSILSVSVWKREGEEQRSLELFESCSINQNCVQTCLLHIIKSKLNKRSKENVKITQSVQRK